MAATPAPPAGAPSTFPPSASLSPTRWGGSPPRPSGRAARRRRSTRPRWTASPSGRPPPWGRARPLPCSCTPEDYDVVDTGDPMPPGRDAVVMREQVHPVPAVAGLLAELRTAVPPYQHVRSIGEDIAAGELLLPEGHRLRAVDVAAAAAAGARSLLVRRAPLVAVVPTGDEVRPLGSDLQPGEIPDTNSLMLAAQAREAGCVGGRAADRAGRPGPHRTSRPRGGRGRGPGARGRGLERRARRLHGPCRGRARHPRRARCRRAARTPGRPRPGRPHPGGGLPGLPRVGRADLRHLRRPRSWPRSRERRYAAGP